jgi:uncharacterized protein with NRDE domain
MCTVTVVPVRDGVRLACNRDERRSRPEAFPPRVVRAGARRAAGPVDAAAGGTWVAVTDAGLALALLNVNSGSGVASGHAPLRSRGTIIPDLLDCGTLAEALARAAAFDPALHAPFRLVLADRRQFAELRSDGRRTDAAPPADLVSSMLFTSSGLGDELVEAPRRELFRATFASGANRVAAQDAFHRYHWPDRPHLSVCMRREDARTVSHTVVSITPARATLTYHPDAPDRPREPVTVRLDLPPEEVP